MALTACTAEALPDGATVQVLGTIASVGYRDHQQRTMLRLDWNALRVGDHVLVHDAAHPALRLVAGVVTVVEPSSGSNHVDIRLTAAGTGNRVIRPARLSVHNDPIEFDQQCWRCARQD